MELAEKSFVCNLGPYDPSLQEYFCWTVDALNHKQSGKKFQVNQGIYMQHQPKRIEAEGLTCCLTFEQSAKRAGEQVEDSRPADVLFSFFFTILQIYN